MGVNFNLRHGEKRSGRLGIRLTPTDRRQLENICIERNITITALFEELLDSYVKSHHDQ